MEDIKVFFENLDVVQILGIVKVILSLFLAFLILIKSGDYNKFKKTLSTLLPTLNNKEVLNMNYRKQHYKEGDKTPGQTFDSMKSIFRLNKVTGELEDTGEKVDIQEIIDSCKDTCLNAVLERFFPTEETDISELPQLNDDLDIMLECSDIAEEYRDKLGLSDKLGISEVFAAMKDYQAQLNEKLTKKEEIKEVPNAKKNEQEGE